MPRPAAPLLLLAAVLLVGCSTGPGPTELRVFAASSLTDAFGELEQRFEQDHPDVDVQLVFAGSQVLRLQIEQGAGADVFASADPHHMQPLVDAGLAEAPRVFARNALTVIVPLDGQGAVASFPDLSRAERLVIGTPAVPAGRYTREVLRRADRGLGAGFADAVLARVVSQESNVRLVRAKVELGEADAAIVFASDAVSSDRVRAVPIPPAFNVSAEYPTARLAGCSQPALAELWLDFLASPPAARVLTRHGFEVD